jgi:hypothetical protein
MMPGYLQQKTEPDLMARIFGLFAKNWHFFSNFKFEQNL